MKQFNLEEYLANPNRKVVTREGYSVKILCTNFCGNQPIVAEIPCFGFSTTVDINGRYYVENRESQYDLFFAPEKHERWVNVYKRADGEYHLGLLCGSKSGAEALRACNEGYTATIKIEWEE